MMESKSMERQWILNRLETLSVYYQQDVTTEWFENCDGERWVMENA